MAPGSESTLLCESEPAFGKVVKSEPERGYLGHSVGENHRKRGVRGYDGAKKVNGRKRHLLVDTGGLLMKAKVHPADLADREGARALLERVGESFPNLEHLWADAGYRGAELRNWITEQLGLTLEIVQRKRRWVWVPNDVEPDPIPAGFEVIRRRWVVERTFAWILRNRRMSRDYELLPETGEALIYVTMIRLMLKRLAKGVE
jgi:putative transposase